MPSLCQDVGQALKEAAKSLAWESDPSSRQASTPSQALQDMPAEEAAGFKAASGGSMLSLVDVGVSGEGIVQTSAIDSIVNDDGSDWQVRASPQMQLRREVLEVQQPAMCPGCPGLQHMG